MSIGIVGGSTRSCVIVRLEGTRASFPCSAANVMTLGKTAGGGVRMSVEDWTVAAVVVAVAVVVSEGEAEGVSGGDFWLPVDVPSSGASSRMARTTIKMKKHPSVTEAL